MKSNTLRPARGRGSPAVAAQAGPSPAACAGFARAAGKPVAAPASRGAGAGVASGVAENLANGPGAATAPPAPTSSGVQKPRALKCGSSNSPWTSKVGAM